MELRARGGVGRSRSPLRHRGSRLAAVTWPGPRPCTPCSWAPGGDAPAQGTHPKLNLAAPRAAPDLVSCRATSHAPGAPSQEAAPGEGARHAEHPQVYPARYQAAPEPRLAIFCSTFTPDFAALPALSSPCSFTCCTEL